MSSLQSRIFTYFFLLLLDSFVYLDGRLSALEQICCAELTRQGFHADQISMEYFLHLRYDGTDCALMCSPLESDEKSPSPQHGDFLQSFLNRFV